MRRTSTRQSVFRLSVVYVLPLCLVGVISCESAKTIAWQSSNGNQRVAGNAIRLSSNSTDDVVVLDDSVYGAKPGLKMTTNKGGIVRISDGGSV